MTFANAAPAEGATENRRRVPVRDVVVMRAADVIPDNINASRQLRGQFREEALREFRRGDPANYVFWYAPLSGRSTHQLETADEISWE